MLTESRVRGKRKNKPEHNYGYNISTIAGSEILKRTFGGEPHSSLQVFRMHIECILSLWSLNHNKSTFSCNNSNTHVQMHYNIIICKSTEKIKRKLLPILQKKNCIFVASEQMTLRHWIKRVMWSASSSLSNVSGEI